MAHGFKEVVVEGTPGRAEKGKRLEDQPILTLYLLAFILFSVCHLFFPTPAPAAQKTIGVIIPGDIPYYRDIHNAFMAKLNREGYGAMVEIVVQKPYPDPISLSNSARKLIAFDIDVIVTYGTSAAIAVFGEKTKIPLVYSAVYDPLTPKIKARNITGISSKVSVSSLLRYLRGMAFQMRELLRLSQQYGFRVEGAEIKRIQDARTALSGKKVDALFITSSAVANIGSPALIEFAREHKIPTASLLPDKNHHAIITLSANPREQGEKVAEMVIKILDGANPERIKPDSSNSTDLVFNLKEAMTMGFKIPMDLVTEATRLIQ
jgi:putative ABC transport system substrate-binding protein